MHGNSADIGHYILSNPVHHFKEIGYSVFSLNVDVFYVHFQISIGAFNVAMG